MMHGTAIPQNKRVDLPQIVRAWWSGVQERHAGVGVTVRFDDSGIAQITSASHTQLTWPQTTEVYAYKRDCFGIDQIRAVLGNETLRTWIYVGENDDGYEELIATLPRYVPGCTVAEEWWQRVAIPPFEAQWMALYKRT
jgi:hypothetical protein